jgi:hypothetical protein
MAEQTGASLYLTFGTTVLSSDFRTFNESEEVGLVKASAGSDTFESYLTTLHDGTAKVQLVYQSLGSAVWAAVKEGTSGTLIWAPEGTATGKPKHTVNTAIVKSRSKDIPYENLIVLNVDFQFSAAVTDGVY